MCYGSSLLQNCYYGSIYIYSVNMPEGPEVTHITAWLRERIVGKTLKSIELVLGPYVINEKPKYATFREQVRSWSPHKITRIENNGKKIFLYLEGAVYAGMSNNLGMEGWWSIKQEKHTLVTLVFNGEYRLHFNDSRRFGTFELFDSEQLAAREEAMGLDILQPFTVSEFQHCMMKRKKSRLCDVLLDQKIVSGIGNYLRSEICYYARINPHRRINTLTRDDFRQLSHWTRELIHWILPNPDAYQFKVYQQTSVDGLKVEKEQIGKRFIYWTSLQK